MSPREVVKNEGFKLSVGVTTNVDCPFCDGGDRRDKGTCSITRDSSSLVLYICHRAKCGSRGRILANGAGFSAQHNPSRKFVPNPYKGQVQDLDIQDLSYLSDKWHVDLEDVYNAGWRIAFQEGGFLPLIMPVISPVGGIRGHVLRVQNEDDTKKVRSFKVADEPWLSWYITQSNDIVVVEDQISALRAAEFCTSVALLGSEMSQDKFEEIVYVAGQRKIWIALDRDAVKEGMELIRRYRLYFPNLNLLFLRKDIKNMTTSELVNMGGPFNA